MTQRAARWVAAALGLLVVLLGMTAFTLSVGGDTDAMAECATRVRLWESGNHLWREAGSPPVVCMSGPRPGHSGLWDGRAIRVWPAGAAYWDLSPSAFYDDILWHEMGHAWASNVAHLDERRGDYETIRGIVGVTPAESNEDYAETFSLSLGHTPRWFTCDAGYCWSHRPTEAELARLRETGLLPQLP